MQRLFQWSVLRISAVWCTMLVLFAPGCYLMNEDGKASNDHLAFALGCLGIITFFSGIKAEKAFIILLGVLLIVA